MRNLFSNPAVMQNLMNMFGGSGGLGNLFGGAGGMNPNLGAMFNNPETMQNLMNMFGGGAGGAPNLANMFGGAGGAPNLANMFGGAGGAPNLANMFGGAGLNPGAGSNMFNSPAASSPPVNTDKQSKTTGHSALKFKTLVIHSKQPTLFSTSVSIDKVFAKLNQFIGEVSFPVTPEQVKILSSLQASLENRKQNPNFEIPLGTFKLAESLIKLLPLDKLFPFLDILRLLVLHKTVSDYYSNSQGFFSILFFILFYFLFLFIFIFILFFCVFWSVLTPAL